MEAFMAKSQASQLLEIWLNGRETNGSVAEAWREIDKIARELQQARLDLSGHLAEQHETSINVKFIKRWGARGTGLILLAVGMLGGSYYAVQIWRLFR